MASISEAAADQHARERGKEGDECNLRPRRNPALTEALTKADAGHSKPAVSSCAPQGAQSRCRENP